MELEFPSPWLNHQPTRLTVKRGSKHRLHVEDIRSGYAEAFIEQLKGFADGVAQGRALRNSAEEAARDMDLLCGLARWRMASLSQPPFPFSRLRDRPDERVEQQSRIHPHPPFEHPLPQAGEGDELAGTDETQELSA
jgi:hypothetical protein